MPDTPPARERRRVPWWGWTLVAIAAAVALVAALGGFNDVPVQKLPQIQVGDTQVGNELSLQVNDIYMSRTSPVTGYDAKQGKVYLVVETLAENVTDAPNLFIAESLRVVVDGVLDGNDDPYSVVELRTGGYQGWLQPGLPTRIAFLWEIGGAAVQPGDEIFLGVFERYDFVDDPRFDDSKTAPVPIVRLVETIGGYR